MGLNQRALEKRIAAGERVLLDTSVMIAYLNGAAGEPTFPVVRHFIEEMLKVERNAALYSAVSVVELLIRPLRAGGPAVGHVNDFLSHTVGLRVVSINMAIAQEAASLRATHNFKTPDALVIATGIVYQVSHLLTNDELWRDRLAPLKERVRVTMPKDYL